MKKITIELTDTEYKNLEERAYEVAYKLEDYIIIAARLYKETYRKTYDQYNEIQDLRKENKILKQNLGIKE